MILQTVTAPTQRLASPKPSFKIVPAAHRRDHINPIFMYSTWALHKFPPNYSLDLASYFIFRLQLLHVHELCSSAPSTICPLFTLKHRYIYLPNTQVPRLAMSNSDQVQHSLPNPSFPSTSHQHHKLFGAGTTYVFTTCCKHAVCTQIINTNKTVTCPQALPQPTSARHQMTAEAHATTCRDQNRAATHLCYHC